jgi:hypothetical protein
MLEQNPGGGGAEGQPEGEPGVPPEAPPGKEQPAEVGMAPQDVDDDFPTYANEANKELNRKVRQLAPRRRYMRRSGCLRRSRTRRRNMRSE